MLLSIPCASVGGWEKPHATSAHSRTRPRRPTTRLTSLTTTCSTVLHGRIMAGHGASPIEVFVLSVCFFLAPSRVRVLPSVKSGTQSSSHPASLLVRSLLVDGPRRHGHGRGPNTSSVCASIHAGPAIQCLVVLSSVRITIRLGQIGSTSAGAVQNGPSYNHDQSLR